MNLSKEIKLRNRYYKSIGAKSIYDIIKRHDWTTDIKIAYIRHHYTYYNQHMDMFHDEYGNKNKNSEILNDIIRGIVTNRWDASILSMVNKSMIEWRKSHPLPENNSEDNMQYYMDVSDTVSDFNSTSNFKKEKEERRLQKQNEELAQNIQLLLEKAPYYEKYFTSAYIKQLATNAKNIVPISENRLERIKQLYIQKKGSFSPMDASTLGELNKDLSIQDKFIKGYNKLYKELNENINEKSAE